MHEHKFQKRILVYNGDVDALVTYLGNQWFLDDLNLTVLNYMLRDKENWNDSIIS